MKEGTFRFNARKVFLTYAKCPLAKSAVYEAINSKYPVKYACVCIEEHEDGEKHLHCAIEFMKKTSSRKQTMFDVEGYHPNIQVPKNWPATKNYVKKDKDFEIWENDDDDDEDVDFDLYQMAEELGMKEYFEFCRKKKVQGFYSMQAWRSVGSMFTIEEDYEEPPEATVCSGLNSLDLDAATYDRKAVVIIGQTGCGKSTIAKRLCKKPALWVTHTDGLKNLRRQHKSIIFDDMSFMHLNRNAQLHLLETDNPTQIHVRYGIVHLPAGIQKIFTANEEIFLDDPAINRRRVNIYSNGSIKVWDDNGVLIVQ